MIMNEECLQEKQLGDDLYLQYEVSDHHYTNIQGTNHTEVECDLPMIPREEKAVWIICWTISGVKPVDHAAGVEE